MSNWKRTPSKRQSNFTDSDRLGSHPSPFLRQSVTSQSLREIPGLQTLHEERLPMAPNRRPSMTSQPGGSLEIVLPHLVAPPQATTTAGVLQSLPPTNFAHHNFPPISLPPPRQSFCTSHHVGQTFKQETNDTACQTLRRDDLDLIPAYPSTQIRIADLDEAAQASNLERASLAKDRQRLKAKIDVLEAEVVELQSLIDVSQQHTAAKDAQYSQIVEMSTRLQTQSASDSHQWKVEQKQWACEKRDMHDTIAKLRSEVRNLQTGLSRPTALHTEKLSYRFETRSQSTQTATDEASLEQHSKSLQYANASMEAVLIGVSKEYGQLTEYIEKLGSIGKNIQTQLQNVGLGDSVPRMADGE